MHDGRSRIEPRVLEDTRHCETMTNEDVRLQGIDLIEVDAVGAFRTELAWALASNELEAVQRHARNLSITIFTLPAHVPVLLDLAIDAAFSPEGLRSEGSSSLLSIPLRYWECLTEEQREHLLRLIEGKSGSFTYWFSLFTISEILGECYANSAAFDVLSHLRSVEDETVRIFIPHGFEHLVSDSGNDLLARRAFSMLISLKDDPSEQVREEAEISIARLRGVTREFALDPLHADRKWREPWNSYQVGEVVEATVIADDEAGLIVEVDGEREFVFQDETGGPRQLGETLRLKIKKVDQWRGDIQLGKLDSETV